VLTSYSLEEVQAMGPDEVLGALMSRPADVYPLYRRLRAIEPRYVSPSGVRFLSRYDDIRAMMRSPACVQADAEDDPRALTSDWLRARPLTLLFANPPAHTRMRSLVSRAFTVRAVDALRPMIQRYVDARIDACAAKGVFDLAADLGDLLPTEVVTTMRTSVGWGSGRRESMPPRRCGAPTSSWRLPTRRYVDSWSCWIGSWRRNAGTLGTMC
jgi:cytochrome P450